MLPLIMQLSARLLYLSPEPALQNLGCVKPVAAPLCFLCDDHQERSHRVSRPSFRPKPHKLWMLCIAARLPCQHLLREQSLSPCRRQPFHIEIFWMQSPKSHIQIIENPSSTICCLLFAILPTSTNPSL